MRSFFFLFSPTLERIAFCVGYNESRYRGHIHAYNGSNKQTNKIHWHVLHQNHQQLHCKTKKHAKHAVAGNVEPCATQHAGAS